MRSAHELSVGKPEGKGSLGIWEDIIKIGLSEIGREDEDWIHLAQDRNWWWALVNTVMNLRVP
jgi:hypothetical protein